MPCWNVAIEMVGGRMRLAVYVGGKISDDTPEKEEENLQRIRDLSLEVIRLGHKPFPVGWNSDMGKDAGFTRQDWYDYDNTWLDRCDVGVFVREGLEESYGAQEEIKRMLNNNQAVFYGEEEFREFCDDV